MKPPISKPHRSNNQAFGSAGGVVKKVRSPRNASLALEEAVEEAVEGVKWLVFCIAPAASPAQCAAPSSAWQVICVDRGAERDG